MQPNPGGTHVLMESLVENGQKIYAIGYKYSSNKVFSCIASESTGNTSSGKPYEAGWADLHGNVRTCFIYSPYIISTYFDFCGIIDSHN